MFGIVYSTNTGRLRWFTGSGHSTTELDGINLLPGEALIKADDNNYGDAHTIQAFVTTMTGKTPANDRYVFVPVGPTAIAFHIVDVHIMDPLIDTVPNGMQAIAHPTAGPGWTYTQTGGLAPPPPSVITK